MSETDQFTPASKKKRVEKSGHQKREEARKKHLVAASLQVPKITSFFHAANSTQNTIKANLSPEENYENQVEVNISEAEASSSQQQTKIVEALLPLEEPLSEEPSSDLDDIMDTEAVENSVADADEASDITEISLFAAPSPHAHINEKLNFLKRHPIQPEYKNEEGEKLPFSSKVYKRKLPNGEFISRNWLSYSSKLNKVFCPVCMVFGFRQAKSNYSNFSQDGVNDFKHIHQRVEEHEKSNSHSQAVNAFFHAKHNANIEHKINLDLENLKRNKILRNRLIIRRIIDIILFITKQNLSYRGKHESSYYLTQTNSSIIRRGNFLELCLLLAKYDDIMKTHLQYICFNSQKKNRKGTTAQLPNYFP